MAFKTNAVNLVTRAAIILPEKHSGESPTSEDVLMLKSPGTDFSQKARVLKLSGTKTIEVRIEFRNQFQVPIDVAGFELEYVPNTWKFRKMKVFIVN